MIKAILLAPIQNSLYARLVAHLLIKEKNIELAAIVVRSPLNIKRFRSEFRRDGSRLIRKIFQKLVVGDKRFTGNSDKNLALLARQQNLQYRSLKSLAKDLKIPYSVVNDHNHPRSLEIIERLNPDIILFTGGGILRSPLLNIPRLGTLNCHTGVLPQYRGMDVVEWTAIEGKINSVGFGATLHFMDEGVDTGPILIKEKIFAPPDATFESIRAELETLMVDLMIRGARQLSEGSLIPEQQALKEGRQYFVMHPRIKAAAITRLKEQLKESIDS